LGAIGACACACKWQYNGGENLGFRKAEADTAGTTYPAEFGDVVGKVNVAETCAGVIEAGEADRGGEGAGGKRLVKPGGARTCEGARTKKQARMGLSGGNLAGNLRFG
jgi:hypothetical protein